LQNPEALCLLRWLTLLPCVEQQRDLVKAGYSLFISPKSNDLINSTENNHFCPGG
jgi:hypothetical protein